MEKQELRSESFLKKFPPECLVITRLIQFNNNKQQYKFEKINKWGTKKDWALYLWQNSTSTFIKEIVEDFITCGLLKYNGEIVKQGKYFKTYKLSKKWLTILQDNFVDNHAFTIFLEQIMLYEIKKP